ncbi:fibronectin type III domain-containing protein [Candidatus Margulisiibacteriota bacterium]
MKLLFRIGGLALLVFLLCSQVSAAGIYLRITKDGLEGWTGTIDPNYNGNNAGSANIEFFQGSIPADPTATSGRYEPVYNWLSSSQTHQYENTTISGSSCYMRIWDGSPRTEGSYYGKSKAYKAAAGSQPALQYDVTSFKTDFLAAKPVNAPTIKSVSESNQRIGDTADVILKLSVSYTYDMGSPKIEATGYDMKYWIGSLADEPDDSDPNRVVSLAGTSFSLPDKDPASGKPFGSGTYYFKVRARNWFGAGPWSDTKEWTTLSGIIGGAVAFDFNLKPYQEDKIVVNSITVPSLSLSDGSVAYASELAAYINGKAGEGKIIVTAISRWDAEAGAPEGLSFNEDGSVSSGVDFTLTPGEGVQVFTTEELNITLQGQ